MSHDCHVIQYHSVYNFNTFCNVVIVYTHIVTPHTLTPSQMKSLHDGNKRMKKLIQQRNSVRLSMCYDNVSFTKEQLALLEDREQTIGDLQFSLDERTAQLEEV